MNTAEELSLQDKEAIDELKGRVAGEIPPSLKDDAYLYLRFLTARNFNIDVAENMLRNHLHWRKCNQIDCILNTYRQKEVILGSGKMHSIVSPSEIRQTRMGIIQKYMPLTRIGFDKEGAPVRYFEFGEMDSKGLLKCVKKGTCINSVVRCLEEDIVAMKEQTKKFGQPVEQWIYIFNFENYTFAKATHKPSLEAVLSLFLTYEANYPERLKAAYVINAPVYFTILFAVVKPLLSGSTLQKLEIFGKDGWKEALLKHIDEKDLPGFLGGQKTDPDGNPMCKTFVKHAHLVPEELYASNSTKRLSNQRGVKKVTVARMSKVNLNLDVAEPGSVIEWEFETDGKDIGFELHYKDSSCDDSTKELLPNQRIETSVVSEVGMYHCKFPGTYIIVFDNSYGWVHQKNVYYRVSVTSPKHQKTVY